MLEETANNLKIQEKQPNKLTRREKQTNNILSDPFIRTLLNLKQRCIPPAIVHLMTTSSKIPLCSRWMRISMSVLLAQLMLKSKLKFWAPVSGGAGGAGATVKGGTLTEDVWQAMLVSLKTTSQKYQHTLKPCSVTNTTFSLVLISTELVVLVTYPDWINTGTE